MKITERDIELMGWILEQKFMTEKQVRQVFWKGRNQDNREAYRRLNKLRNMGFLTVNMKKVYRSDMYLVTAKGVRQLKELNKNHGLSAMGDADYSNYRHDLVVTDIRILFDEMGYKSWLSERVLSRRNDLRRVPDGMVFNKDKYIAMEYESSQKSRRRYQRIFLDYEFDRKIDQVLYIVDTKELVGKLSREVSTSSKANFVYLGELEKELMNARLKSIGGECVLRELLGIA